MAEQPPFELTLQIARSVDADDPYAFARGMQEYVIFVDGEAVRETSLKWDRQLMALLDAVRRPGRDPAQVAELGERLRTFLAPADWASVETRIEAAVESGQPVLLTLRLAAAELFSLPFELLRLRASGDSLGSRPGVLLRYCWPEARSKPEPTPPRMGDGRLVFAWSAAGGRVPSRSQQAALVEAAERGVFPFDPHTDVLPRLSYGALAERLSAGPVSALVLLAHGVPVGDSGQTFGIRIDDGMGGVRDLDAAALVRLLKPHAARLRLVVLAACDGGNPGALGNALGSMAQSLHRAGIAAVVASRFPLSVEGANLLVAQLFQGLLVGPRSLEDSLRTARSGLTREVDSLDWASVQLFSHPADGEDSRPIVIRPYRGLLAFSPAEARFFFGRDAERHELEQDLEALQQEGKPRFVIVAGASGTGKSSVVLGGAIPDLVAGAGRRDSAGRTDDPELRAIVQRMSKLEARYDSPTVREAASKLRAFADHLHTTQATGWVCLRPGLAPMRTLADALRQRTDDSAPFLVVVDQLEEIFTHVPELEVREAFCRRLWALASGDTGVSVICTIRVDFLGDCGQVVLDDTGLRLDTVAYDEAHRVFVAQMRPAQLRQCIEAPARAVGLQLEPGLAQSLVEELKSEPGALPLLSHVMDQLWKKRDARGRLSLAAYRELGGVGGCLEREASAVVAGMEESGMRQLRRLMPRLVSTEGQWTRRRAFVDDLRPSTDGEQAAFDGVVQSMVARRLLVQAEASGRVTLEVSHEALLRQWAQLRQWVVESDDLLDAVKTLEACEVAWQEHRALLSGAQLDYAEAFVTRYPDEVGPALRDLMDRSRDELETVRSSWLFVSLAFSSGIITYVLSRLWSGGS